MKRYSFTHALLACVFVAIGLSHSIPGHLSISEGSLPTISRMRADMKRHTDKDTGLQKGDGRLEKVENPILQKTMNPILSKNEGCLSGDLY